MIRKAFVPALLALALPFGCAGIEDESLDDVRVKGDNGKDDSSAEAVFLDFEFDGELLTNSAYNPTGKVEDQLLYTIGHLNGDRSLGRLDKLEVTDIQTSSEEGKTLIRYHAKMPVAWAERNGVPESYTFRLPRDMSYQAIGEFAEKYGHSCVSYGAHDVDAGNMWYYYRPEGWNCSLADEDIVTLFHDIVPLSLCVFGHFIDNQTVVEHDLKSTFFEV